MSLSFLPVSATHAFLTFALMISVSSSFPANCKNTLSFAAAGVVFAVLVFVAVAFFAAASFFAAPLFTGAFFAAVSVFVSSLESSLQRQPLLQPLWLSF